MAGLVNILHIRVLVGAVKYSHSWNWRSKCAQLVVWWVVSLHVHMCIKLHILLPSHWCQAAAETGGWEPAQIGFTRVQRYLSRLHETDTSGHSWGQGDRWKDGGKCSSKCFYFHLSGTILERALQEVKLKSRCELDGLDRSFNTTKLVSSQKVLNCRRAPSLNLSCRGKSPNVITPTTILGEAPQVFFLSGDWDCHYTVFHRKRGDGRYFDSYFRRFLT